MSDSIPAPDAEGTQPRRKPVSKSLRFQILRRDNHTCRYCGATAPDSKIGVDHVVPVALGGTDEPTNLVACCPDCNAGKSATPADAAIVADVAQDALRWEAVTRAATEKLQADRDRRSEFVRKAFALWDEWCPGWKDPKDAGNTFERWFDRGVTVEDIEYAALVTATTRGVAYHWAYFCGIVNKNIRKRDEMARQMLDAERADG